MGLRLKNVSRIVQGQHYLRDIDISLERGSFNVLMGRTLAGKTSLMRVVAGLDHPSSGSVEMDGVDVTGVPVQKRKISMVYQQFINYPNLSVFENIASPLRIAGDSNSTIKDKVESIAEMLHIEDYLQRRPLELSGGQQQRTAMARALVKDSDLILFDEPLVNLDYKLREELRFELRELFKRRNVIAVYATTEANEALALGGVTTLMHEGRIIQSGPVSEAYRKPNTIQAAELFSEPAINIIAGTVKEQSVLLENGVGFNLAQDKALTDGPYRFGIRPHHLTLERHNGDDVTMNLNVDVAEISGSETYLHISSNSLNLVAQLNGVLPFHTDAQLKVYFSPHTLYVFNSEGETVSMPRDRGQSNTAAVPKPAAGMSHD
ncbi:MAG: glycerol transport system ATP-binding protein [Arenicella sp.]|jgi:glycerol transport system ATP-binding protein